MERVYGGFFAAAALGIPLGLMIGRIKVIRQLLDPTLSLLRPIPVTAWLPLSMIFFGLGPKAAIFLVFLGAFYPILLNTIFGVRSVDPRLFEAAAMLGCSGGAMFRQIVLPASMPAIFNGLRLGHGFAAEEQVWLMGARADLTPGQGKKYRLKLIQFQGPTDRFQAYLAGELDARAQRSDLRF